MCSWITVYREEMKMTNETKRSWATIRSGLRPPVRIPTVGGHSESVNIEFENDFDLAEVKDILSNAPGVVLKDDVANLSTRCRLRHNDKDDTFVGRIRRDETQPKTLNCWIVSDNLLGAPPPMPFR